MSAALRGTRRLAIGAQAESAGRLPLRSLFLGIQVALCTLLLVGAGLLTRSVVRTATLDLGYTIDGIVRVRPVLPPAGNPRPEQLGELLRLIQQTLADSGIEAAEASLEPLSFSSTHIGARLPGEPQTSARRAFTLDVSPGYFALLRLPFVDGRTFTDADDASDVVISESLAQQLWPDGRAVGRSLVIGGSSRVVGVVADAYLTGLHEIEPVLFRQARIGKPMVPRALLMRDDAASIERMRAVVAAAIPGSRLTVRSISANVRSRLELPRLGASIALAIGLCGVTLAAIGVFGVFAYAVGQRAREIGIRIALGARRLDVLRWILRLSGWPLVSGLAAGLTGAVVATPLLRSYLYGIGPHDPLAFVSAAALLVVSAAVAALAPTRRALRVDPVAVLRAE
jgi:hypothetical protein